MNKVITIIIAFYPVIFLAQNIEIGAGVGTGAFYFIEEADNNVFTAYDSPLSIYFDLKYKFDDRIDGLKLRLQNTSVNVVGEDYQTRARLDGIVESFTFSLLYERLRSDKIFNIGYHAGFGYTQQDFTQIKNRNLPALEDRFISATAAAVYSLRLKEKLRLKLETGMLWTDVSNSFRGSRNWQTAGEDLSFLVQIGVSYAFDKK
jgi:hypothetical protein